MGELMGNSEVRDYPPARGLHGGGNPHRIQWCAPTGSRGRCQNPNAVIAGRVPEPVVPHERYVLDGLRSGTLPAITAFGF